MQDPMDLDSILYSIVFEPQTLQQTQSQWKIILRDLEDNLGNELSNIDHKIFIQAIKMLALLNTDFTIPEKFIGYLLSQLQKPAVELKNTIIYVLAVYYAVREQDTQMKKNFRNYVQQRAVDELSPQVLDSLNKLQTYEQKCYILGVIFGKGLGDMEEELLGMLEAIPRLVLVKQITENGDPEDIMRFKEELEKMEKSIDYQLYEIERDQCLRHLLNSKERFDYSLDGLIEIMINDQTDGGFDTLGNSLNMSGGIKSSFGQFISKSKIMRTTNMRATTVMEPIPQEMFDQQNTGEIAVNQDDEEQDKHYEEKKEKQKSELKTSQWSIQNEAEEIPIVEVPVLPKIIMIRKPETTTDLLFGQFDQ